MHDIREITDLNLQPRSGAIRLELRPKESCFSGANPLPEL